MNDYKYPMWYVDWKLRKIVQVTEKAGGWRTYHCDDGYVIKSQQSPSFLGARGTPEEAVSVWVIASLNCRAPEFLVDKIHANIILNILKSLRQAGTETYGAIPLTA